MKSPSVHVLIINWNGLEHLETCFDSLLAGTYPNVRYVLLDNASTDGSVAFVRERYGADPRVDIVECPRNMGWSGGNNVGLRRALDMGADYVFLLNNDTWTAPDAIVRMVEMADSQPELGALAPKMLMFYQPELINSVGLACTQIGNSWDLGIGRLDGPAWDVSQTVIGVCGGACFLRVAALRKTGLLPEEFGIYLDDLDLCLRIWDAGWAIRSCPGAVVRHKFGATMEQGARARHKYFLNTRNRMYLVLRNFPVQYAWRYKPAILLGECRAIGRALLNHEPWRAWVHVRAWAAAAMYLPAAWRERRKRRQAGLASGRFWPLIRTSQAFFEGTEFPEDGWYAAQSIDGYTVRPMSARATASIEPGELRITVFNRYPAIGPVTLRLLVDGAPLATIQTLDRYAGSWSVSGKTLVLEAQQIFRAEDTGERVDLGGWIAIEPRMAQHA